MEPREFFIEERLERNRNNSQVNLGESGYHAFQLGDVLKMAGLNWEEISKIPLYDSPNQGSLSLRKEVAALYPGVSPDEVLICTGTSEALYLAFHLLLAPGQSVALYFPAFQALYEIPMMLGAKIIPLSPNTTLKASDWENVEADLYVINQPHNPTGFAFEELEQGKLIEILSRKNKPVLFDEHYRLLDRNSDLGWTGVSPKLGFYGTGSFTKCFGVTGLRIGWLIGDRDFIRRARSFKDYLTHTVSPISESIAIGLLRNRQGFQNAIKSEIISNIDYFESNLSLLTDIVNYEEVKGGLVGWVKLKDGLKSEQYADALLEKTGVFVLPGINFEMEGYLRIGFGEKHAKFCKGLDLWIKSIPLI